MDNPALGRDSVIFESFSGRYQAQRTRQKPFLGHILLHGKSESVQLCLQLPEGDEKMK